jgi:hypothetical protein
MQESPLNRPGMDTISAAPPFSILFLFDNKHGGSKDEIFEDRGTAFPSMQHCYDADISVYGWGRKRQHDFSSARAIFNCRLMAAPFISLSLPLALFLSPTSAYLEHQGTG